MSETERLALAFEVEVRAVTTPEEVAWILAENSRRRAAGDLSSCASHDVYDSNESMDRAFEALFGREADAASDADSALWNAAWAIVFP